MGRLYVGSRMLYTDDQTGIIWDSPKMQQRCNLDGTPYVEETRLEVEVNTIPGMGAISVSSLEPGMTKTVIEEPEKTILICDICGFEAKSKTGLAVHSMKHKVQK